MTPDYYKRFRERFVTSSKVTKSGEEVHAEPDKILAFTDEVVAATKQDWFIYGQDQGRKQERTSLIKVVEAEKREPKNLRYTNDCATYFDHAPQWDGNFFTCSFCGLEFVPAAQINTALDAVLAHLLQDQTVSWKEVKHPDATLRTGEAVRTYQPIGPYPRPQNKEPRTEETEKGGSSFSGRGEVERTNELLRSMASIVARRGKDVNWDAFGAKLDAELARQHAIMFPRPKETTTPSKPQDGIRAETLLCFADVEGKRVSVFVDEVPKSFRIETQDIDGIEWEKRQAEAGIREGCCEKCNMPSYCGRDDCPCHSPREEGPTKV